MEFFSVGSLFSGLGGIELGFEKTGKFETRWFIENDRYCQAILRKHWPQIPIYGDIRKINFKELPGVDVLTGGFPCQDISNAGKRKGIEGERSGLWKEYLRAISEIRPKYCLVENVSALTFRGLLTVLGDLAEVGYDAEWHCVPASALGAPHRRDRIYIMAYSNSQRHVHEQSQEHTTEGREFAQRDTCSKSNVANSHRATLARWNQEESSSGKSKEKNRGRSNTLPNADYYYYYWKQRKEELREENRRTTWATDSGILRVAHGIPTRLHYNLDKKRQGTNKNGFTSLDEFNWRILSELWQEKELTEASQGLQQPKNNYSLPELPQEFAHERKYLGKRIEEDEELHYLWETVFTKPQQETQNLRKELLERIREIERIKTLETKNRTNRIKCLGNAVVPQVAEFFGEMILKRMEKIDYD